MKVQQDKLRYPIGQFEYGKTYSLDDTRKHIKILARFPKDLKNALKKLKSGDLEKTYRPEGWTIRQVVNHIADSHLNAYVRVKLAITENTPIIKPYEQELWAELEDGKHGSVKTSLKLLSALHKRWTNFLKSIQEDDLEKGYYHPASKRTVSLQEAIALYVWHSSHHLAHIYLVIEGKSQRMGGKKASEEAKADTDNGSKSVAPAQAPKKRTITPEHREKIRAAQLARRQQGVSSAATDSPAAPAAPAAKRGRKPGVKAAAAPLAASDVQPAKRGRKPGVKPVATADAPAAKRGRKPGVKAAAAPLAASDVQPAKRGRKPGVKPAATADSPAAKRGRKPGVKAAAAPLAASDVQPAKRGRKPGVKTAGAADAPAAKRGRKPGVKAVETMAGEPAKRKRRTKAEMEMVAADGAAQPVKSTKVKAEKPAPTPGTEAPKKRGLSAERMAEIRAMKGSKKPAEDAAAAPVKTAKVAKPAKVANAAPAPGTEAPKKRGLSAERMAEIRAMKGTKKAAETTAETAAKPTTAAKPVKAAKTATTASGDAPKRRGLSPERMAEIRAMKKKKE